jgi:hypothetical protein
MCGVFRVILIASPPEDIPENLPNCIDDCDISLIIYLANFAYSFIFGLLVIGFLVHIALPSDKVKAAKLFLLNFLENVPHK